jgi:predicted nucleotidyltransferase
MNMEYKQIEEILGPHKKELVEKYKIKEIGIFGSYVGERRACKRLKKL